MKTPIENKLRYYRNMAGLRQIDVAQKLGFVSPDRISHWERGTNVPNIINLAKLSVLYQTPFEDLYRELFNQIDILISEE